MSNDFLMILTMGMLLGIKRLILCEMIFFKEKPSLDTGAQLDYSSSALENLQRIEKAAQRHAKHVDLEPQFCTPPMFTTGERLLHWIHYFCFLCHFSALVCHVLCNLCLKIRVKQKFF